MKEIELPLDFIIKEEEDENFRIQKKEEETWNETTPHLQTDLE